MIGEFLQNALCLLATVDVVVSQSPEPVDCSQFSPDPNPPPLQCIPVTSNDFPKTFTPNSNLVQIFHYDTGADWTKYSGRVQTMQSVADAVDYTMPRFSNFADTFWVNIVIVNTLAKNYAGLAKSSTDGSSCFVQIAYPANDQMMTALPQVVAHELYHCVQARNNPQIKGAEGLTFDEEDAWPGWWVEASAEYFANSLYSMIAATSSAVTDYYPLTPLYNYFQAYRAGLFLQYWSNSGMSDVDVNAWVANHVLEPTLDYEATQLSQDTTVVSQFPTFASAYWSNNIKLSDGTVVVNGQRNDAIQAWTLTFPADYSVYTQPYKIDPFTINVFSTMIQPGQMMKITLSTTDTSTVLQYRQAGSSSWRTWSDGVSLPSDCSSDTAATWEFILTTTRASMGLSAGSVIFEKSDSQDCGCDSSSKLPLDSCLAGSWALDTDGLRTLIQTVLQNEGATITDLTITGGSTMEITLPPESSSTITFTDFTVSMAITVGGFDATSSVDLTGTVSAGVVMQTADKAFCWQSPVSQGTAIIEIDGVQDTENIDQTYGQSGTIFEYTCNANTLTLTGSFGGKQILQMVYKKTTSQRTLNRKGIA